MAVLLFLLTKERSDELGPMEIRNGELRSGRNSCLAFILKEALAERFN